MSILLSSECETFLDYPISTLLLLVSSEWWRFSTLLMSTFVMRVSSKVRHCGVSALRSFFGITRKAISLLIGDKIELWNRDFLE
jgi:hypothetical protein